MSYNKFFLSSIPPFFLLWSHSTYAVPTAVKKVSPPSYISYSLSPFAVKWQDDTFATSYRIVIAQDEYYRGYNVNSFICDNRCISVKVPAISRGTTKSIEQQVNGKSILLGNMTVSLNGEISFIPSQNLTSNTGSFPKIGMNYIAIRTGSSFSQSSDWKAVKFNYANNSTSLTDTKDSNSSKNQLDTSSSIGVVLKKWGFENLKTGAYAVTSLLTLLPKAVPEEYAYLFKGKTLLSLVEGSMQAVQDSNWVADFAKDLITKKLSKKQILWNAIKAQPLVFLDVFVDMFAERIKTQVSNPARGQAVAWFIKYAYLQQKSVLVGGIAGPGAGAVEYIGGMTQLNAEIWWEVLKSVPQLIEGNARAERAATYYYIAQQTEEKMRLYAIANSDSEKMDILASFSGVFESMKSENVTIPIGSLMRLTSSVTGLSDEITYSLLPVKFKEINFKQQKKPFTDKEIDGLKNQAISTVTSFDKAKVIIYESLKSKGELQKASKFLNTYFSDTDRPCFGSLC